MTDLEKYINLFESTSVSFSKDIYIESVFIGTEKRMGVLDNGNNTIVEIPIYSDEPRIALKVYDCSGYGNVMIHFDENGKYVSLYTSTEY